MAIVKLSAIERRRVSVFVTCLVVAAIAWVFVSLSNPYQFTTRQAIIFKNMPQRRAFLSLQSDTVNVTMTGSGWQMLFSKMNPANRAISIDLHTLENKSFVVLNSQLKQINQGRDSDNLVLSINPDTLYFDFTNRVSKRIPVKLDTSFRYQKQFFRSDNIIIKPSYVTISGPANRIDKITEWPSDSLKLSDLNENTDAHVNLRPVNDASMTIVPKAVEVRVPVDEFTEKTLEIPVKLINHNYDNVKIFPQKVRVTFTVALNKYAETNEDLFEASADLDLWRDKGYSTLPVKFTRMPAFSKIVNIEPRNIDFIVKK